MLETSCKFRRQTQKYGSILSNFTFDIKEANLRHKVNLIFLDLYKI